MLFNTEILTSDVDALMRGLAHQGPEFVGIAEASNRIPVPWLCCFRTSDMRTVDASYLVGPNESRLLRVSIPCATVSDARKNLKNNLEVFQRITGNRAIAEGYWKRALKGLDDLPFQFLTLSPVDVFLLNDAEEEAEAFAKCFDRAEVSLAAIKRLAFYDDAYPPYTVEDFYARTREDLDHEVRRSNSAALDAGYSDVNYRVWHRRAPLVAAVPKAKPVSPWWKLW